jgi:hypothetical protein
MRRTSAVLSTTTQLGETGLCARFWRYYDPSIGFGNNLPPAAHERSRARSQPSEEPAHLRFRIVVWTSLEAVQEAVGQEYVIMWRQKASDVVFPDDVETIRRDLEQGCKQLQGSPR